MTIILCWHWLPIFIMIPVVIIAATFYSWYTLHGNFFQIRSVRWASWIAALESKICEGGVGGGYTSVIYLKYIEFHKTLLNNYNWKGNFKFHHQSSFHSYLLMLEVYCSIVLKDSYMFLCMVSHMGHSATHTLHRDCNNHRTALIKNNHIHYIRCLVYATFKDAGFICEV